MSLHHHTEELLRSALRVGDFIIYRSVYSGWRTAQVNKPNPTYITADSGERVFWRRIEGIGRTKEAAEATVSKLRAESDRHRRHDAEERARHLAAIAAIIAEGDQP